MGGHLEFNLRLVDLNGDGVHCSIFLLFQDVPTVALVEATHGMLGPLEDWHHDIRVLAGLLSVRVREPKQHRVQRQAQELSRKEGDGNSVLLTGRIRQMGKDRPGLETGRLVPPLVVGKPKFLCRYEST